MFHVMESPYNNNSSSTELKKTPAYLRPPRRPLKETPPPWKDALKHSCLERARRERQKDAISSRRCRFHFHDFHHERARHVVQEELHECGIGIRRGGGGGGGGGEEMEQVMQRHYTTETPRENDKEQQQQQQDDDEYEISQDELYELMQQVEEELLRQGTSLVSRKYFVYQ
jgi:flagellar motor protein MotB